MVSQASALAVISGALTTTAAREATGARERREAEAAAREAAAACRVRNTKEVIAMKEAGMRTLEQALA